MKTQIKYLVTFTALFSCITLHAQYLRPPSLLIIGAEGELTYSSLKVTDFNQSLLNEIDGKNVMGYAFGPYLRIDADPLYVKSKLLFGFQSGIVEATYNDKYSPEVAMSIF